MMFTKAQPIITFTPNPALDITYQVPLLRIGDTHRVHQVFKRAGGKGLNTASVCAQMGVPATAVGFFTSPDFVADLELRTRDLPELSYKSLPMPFLNRCSVNITAAGNATVFNEAGPDYGELDSTKTAATWEKVWAKALHLDWTPHGALVTVNGSFAPHTPPGTLGKLIRSLQEKDCWVLVDTSGKWLLEAAAAGANCLKPNKKELLEAADTTDVTSGCRKLLSEGASSLLLSSGEDGLGLIRRREGSLKLYQHWAKPGCILEGNPTGAGDAAVAGFISALSQNMTEEECLSRAVAWSAAAVPTEVAGAVQPGLAIEMENNVTHQYKTL